MPGEKGIQSTMMEMSQSKLTHSCETRDINIAQKKTKLKACEMADSGWSTRAISNLISRPYRASLPEEWNLAYKDTYTVYYMQGTHQPTDPAHQPT